MEPVFERHLLTLKLKSPVRFHFNHGGVLIGLLCRALRTHRLPPGLIPFACESGHVRFDAGDSYNIGICLAGDARGILSQLLDGVHRVGREQPDPERPRGTLQGNFELGLVAPVATPDLAGQIILLSRKSRITVRFVSPLRLLRPPALQQRGASFVNEDCFPAPHFLERLYNRVRMLQTGRYPERDERASERPGPVAGAVFEEPRLWWIDVPVAGLPDLDPTRPNGYTVGGVQGTVTLCHLPKAWIPLVVLGQYLHTGENVHHGLGRYLLLECNPAREDPFQPARSYRSEAASPIELKAALDHLLDRSDAAGMNHVKPSVLAEDAERELSELSARMLDGSWKPEALLGFPALKAKGHLRPLAIPEARDRVAQRAACQVLAPALDALLEDCSFAYRKGFSRAGAARAVQKAYADGYRFVLDADILAFFDSVEWSRLFDTLEGLLPFEPLNDLIREWVRLPVVFEGRRIDRVRGLPQGSPIAPLLANLYLDRFDEDLRKQGFRLVRYADDFVVLCRSAEEARSARDSARKALHELGLSLNEEKSAIRNIDDGFTYLGYLFCRSVVLDRRGEGAGAGQETVAREGIPDLAADAIPEASWLAQIPFEEVRRLVLHRPDPAAAARVEILSLSPAAGPLVTTRPVYVTTPATVVRTEHDTLVLEPPGGEGQRHPIRSLSHLVVFGKARVTVPVLAALGRHGVPTFLCRRSGELYGTFEPQAPDWPVWLAQAKAAQDPAVRLRFAREVVMAKLHNFAALVTRFKLARRSEVAEAIRDLERSCVNQQSLESLRGNEGRGAVEYFSSMRESLPAEWSFRGRSAHPAPDPVNSMLSFGYTLLYHHLTTALYASGLNPRIGLFHEEHGTYHALACDLQEEFRHLVDAQVWSMIHRKEVTPADFVRGGEGRYPCLMSLEFRRKFVAETETRLWRVFAPAAGEQGGAGPGPVGAEIEDAGQPAGNSPLPSAAGAGREATTYRAFMDRQARQVKELVMGRRADYTPLRVHA